MVWAGLPETRVLDQGPSLGVEFIADTSANDIYHKYILVDTPWQHGMVYMHGQALADMSHAMITESSASGKEPMQYVLRMA